MAAPQVDAGSSLQAKIQSVVQPKLIENGWVDEEADTTLSEYVTMMLVNGKDLKGVQSELGGDLLGVGEDDPAVGAFARWLFDTVRQLAAPQQQPQEAQAQDPQTQPIPTVQDAQMEDSAAPADAPYVNFSRYNSQHGFGQQAASMYSPHPYYRGYPPQMMMHPFTLQQLQYNQLTQDQYSPTGPRSMRNGNTQGRGRGGRMLGQMNRSMDRSTDLPDNLRRIKGASGISSGRINQHAGREGPPRGPRGSGVANGVQRMMNGGRGGHHNNMGAMANPMMGGPANAQQQMQFMQMMEMQTNMMAQLIANGQMPNMNGNFQHGHRGGRGGQRGGPRGGSKQLHAVNGKMPEGALPGSNTNAGGSAMDIDGDEANHGDKFSTLCRFNLSCTNAACGFAHQSPAAPPNAPVDLSDTCTHGAACTNHKCSGRHPSPAQRNGPGPKSDTLCRFYPNCTAGAKCPFKHPAQAPCKFGGDCSNPNCKFAHPTILCRYNPCLNPGCMYKHADGQKRGKFEDKVWTAEGGEQGGKAERFADFAKQTENGEEELVLPGQGQSEQQQQQQQQNGNADDAMQTQQQQSQETENGSSQAMETQIVV